MQVQGTEPHLFAVPGMAGHTMTLVGDTKVWIVGGFSTDNYYSDITYQYDASNNKWTALHPRGAKPTGRWRCGVVLH